MRCLELLFLDSYCMIDLLLYVPHAEVSESFIEEAYQSLVSKNISRELLYRYMLHEADRGAIEIAYATRDELLLCTPNLSIQIIAVPIPRAFCDLNRPWERAVPLAFDSDTYQSRYIAQVKSDREAHMRAKRAIHIHTMCGWSPVGNWIFTPETTESELRVFLESQYSGNARNIDILTHTIEGKQIGD
jgi:hypothetical protein